MVRFNFGYVYPTPDNPNAIGFACPTTLLISDISQSTRNCKQGQKLEVVQIYHFDQINHTYSILVPESCWKRLSKEATVSLLLVIKIVSKLNVKNEGCVVHAFKGNTREVVTEIQQHPENKQVICAEYKNKYEVRINVDKDSRCENLSCTSNFISMKTSDNKMAVEISVNSGKMKIYDFTMKFACAIDTENSRISVNRKKKCVEGIFAKQYKQNVGRSLIPWRFIEDSEMTSFGNDNGISNYLENRKLDQFMFQPVAHIWKSIQTNPTVKAFNFKVLKCRGLSGVESSVHLIIEDYFLYRGMPFLKIKVIDKGKALQLFGDQAIVSEPVLKILDQSKSVNAININKEEHQRLKEILFINSLRIRQENDGDGADVWFYKTFLQIMFNREATDFNWQRHSPSVLAIARSIDQSYAREDVCQECEKRGAQMKKCGECQSVTYCGRECQKQNWKIHKKECGKKFKVERLPDDDDGFWQSFVQVFKGLEPNILRKLEETMLRGCCDSFLKMMIERADVKKLKMQPGESSKCLQTATCDQPPAGSTIVSTCRTCGKEGTNLRRCGKCKNVSYCDETCQQLDWKNHKKECRKN